VASEGRIPLLVIVTGPPTTRRTTTAHELAEQAGLPLLGKNAIAGVLRETIGTPDRQAARELGMAAFALLFEMTERLLREGRSLVLEASLAVAAAHEWLERLPPCRVLQVLVTPDALELERYDKRVTSVDGGDERARMETPPAMHESVDKIAALVRAELQAIYAP